MTYYATKKASERKSTLRVVLHSGPDCPLLKSNPLSGEIVAISEEMTTKLNQRKCHYCFG
jgi:hypothetical protein